VKGGFRNAVVLAAMLALFAGATRAEDASTSSTNPECCVARFAPIFLWAPINTTSASEGEDAPPEDVTDGATGLNGALGLRFELEKGRTIVSIEELYFSLSRDSTTPSGTPTSLGFKMSLFEAYGGYRVVDSLSVIGGIRFVAGRLEYTRSTLSIDHDIFLFDPVVGVWYRPRLSRGWRAELGADVGGFGVGFDISSSASAVFSWRGKRIGWDVGYRALYMKKSTGDEFLETTFYGPVVGFEVYF
jgi:hypothetical protein